MTSQTHSIKVKVPGKLYIAGEYSILEPGNPAIIVALDAFIICQVQASDLNKYKISSPAISDIPFEYQVGQPHAAPWSYVTRAIQTANEFISHLGHSPIPLSIRLDSQLVSKNGDKYGLGSSGAVTVAVIKAMLSFFQIDYSVMTLFKLAAIASIQVSNKGSMGDIAASSQTGWTYYRSLDRIWLQDQLDQGQPIQTLVNQPWPNLVLESIDVHPSLQLTIGWTGSTASTDQLVTSYEQISPLEQTDYQPQVLNSLIDQLCLILHEGSHPRLMDCLTEIRQQLLALTQQKGLLIETPALSTLIQDAGIVGWAAKSSGAGGGDCGIALCLDPDKSLQLDQLQDFWTQHGITPLHFQPYFTS